MKKLLTILLLIVGCEIEAERIDGCTEPEACNFHPDANVNDGSCILDVDDDDICDNIDDCVGDFDVCGNGLWILLAK